MMKCHPAARGGKIRKADIYPQKCGCRIRFLLLLAGMLLYCATPKAQISTAGIQARLTHVPVLCYHQIRDWQSADSKAARVFITPVNTFRQHIAALHDSGFHSIGPAQLVAYLINGTPLPSRPLLICFDDGTASQCDHALPELDKAGYKAAFFIMTVVLNKPRYMTAGMVKQLAAGGHVIGCHTWDHHDVRKYTDADWRTQVEMPTKQLQAITGRPVQFFAYPFGAWSAAAFPPLKRLGYTAAFQLWAKADAGAPLYTIPRILVDGNWNADQLLQQISRRYVSIK